MTEDDFAESVLRALAQVAQQHPEYADVLADEAVRRAVSRAARARWKATRRARSRGRPSEREKVWALLDAFYAEWQRTRRGARFTQGEALAWVQEHYSRTYHEPAPHGDTIKAHFQRWVRCNLGLDDLSHVPVSFFRRDEGQAVLRGLAFLAALHDAAGRHHTTLEQWTRRIPRSAKLHEVPWASFPVAVVRRFMTTFSRFISKLHK